MIDCPLEKTNITLKMLIACGIISPGIKLFCDNPNAKGIINSDGSIKVICGGIEKTFDFPSGAARYVENRSLNGWIYWQVKSQDALVPLDYFRESFIKKSNKPTSFAS